MMTHFSRKYMIPLLVLMLCVITASGQQAEITLRGTVSGENGEPLVGATVINANGQKHAVTDLDGRFSIVAHAGDRISVRLMGYNTYEIIVGDQTEVNILLTEDAMLIDEVVVIGYGTAKRSTMVGSVGVVQAKDIERRPVTSVGAVLFGAASGILSTSATGIPGDDPSIRIRGFGSINASNSPIIIVDGAEFGLSLRTISPDDIESISILKDASATAIFGSRGANGVVMITTKKGRSDKSTFSVKLQQGINMRFIPEQETASPQEYYQLMFEAKRNSLYFNSSLNMDMATANLIAVRGGTFRGNTYQSLYEEMGGFNPFYGIDNNEIIDPVTGLLNPAATRLKWGDDLDWAAPMSRVGKRTDLSVSAGGGNAKSDYFVSFNYLNDDAWMRRSFTDRMTVRANINFSPIKWLRMGTNILGSLVHSYNQSWSGDGTTNPFYTARIIGSIYPVHLHDQLTGEYILDANGNKIWDTGGQEIDGVSYPRRPAASGNRNIVAEIMLDDMQYKRLSLQTRTYAEIMFLNDFKFTVSANIVYSPYSGYSYSSNKIGANAAAANPEERGASSRSERTNSYETYQQLLSYNKVLADKHEINAVIGHENFETFTKQVTANRTGQIMDGNIELSNFINISSLPNSTTDEHRTEGYFARANYSYDKGRFNVEGSFRRDGTSKFHRDIRWGTFGSIGAGWTVTREDFMQQLNWINNLKLRASYGSNGNLEGISNYAWQDVYFLNHNNQNEPGYYMDPEAANQFLTWEKLVQFSVAVDYALFNSRIKGSVEFFNKVNEDLVFRVIMPSSTGMTSQMQNIGSLYNRGVEIDISGDIIRNSTLTWNVGFTAATLRNRITRMPDNNPELLSGNKKLMLGHSIYDFWLRDWYGVDPRDGAPVYTYNPETSWSEGTCRVMADGTEVTTDISKALYNYVGSSIPDLYGTLRTFLYYKGFSLNVNFSYQIGGKTYDTVHQTLTQAGRYGYAIHKDLVNRWQKPGDITDVPRMDNTNYSVYTTTSTRYLTNASYLFLHSANLSYALPSNLTEKLKLSSLVVNLSGENLLLFSERKGLNPIESFGGTTSYQYSPSRVITLGLTLTL